ncbi:hypothetical protein ACVWVS_002094 [Ewingella americana]
MASTARRPINTRAASLKAEINPSNLIRLAPAEGFETAPAYSKSFAPFLLWSAKLKKLLPFLLLLSAPAFAAKPVLTVYTYDSFAADWGPGPGN